MEKESTKITFVTNYCTVFGQNMYIAGNCDLLGSWKLKEECKLQWLKGHYWYIDINVSLLEISNLKAFQFKFVCYDSIKKQTLWEKGRNRLFVLDSIKLYKVYSKNTNKINIYLEKELNSNKQKRNIFYFDWEYFEVEFSICYSEIGKNQIKIEDQKMNLIIFYNDSGSHRSKHEMSLSETYDLHFGAKKCFWKVIKNLPLDFEPNKYEYRYIYSFDEVVITNIYPGSYSKKITHNIKSEREPNRILNIYFSEYITKVIDVNFNSEMNYNKIGDYDVFIGPYPQDKDDINKLIKEGVNVILNVQTEEDIQKKNVNIKEITEYFINHTLSDENKVNNIKNGYNKVFEYIWFPIIDFNADDLKLKLFNATEKLNNALSKTGNVVYLHCTAGISRSTATMITYLVKYKKFNYHDACKYVKEYRPQISPNYDVLKELLL